MMVTMRAFLSKMIKPFLKKEMPRYKNTTRSGDGKYKCLCCGYEGYCYGVASSEGISAPFCRQCGNNNMLEPI
jgi:hypothetical protein